MLPRPPEFTAILMFEFWREATATSVPGLLCQSGRRRPENVSFLSSLLWEGGALRKVLVKNNANRFMFQNANLLGIFIHNGRSHYAAQALKRRSRQSNEPPLWGSCCLWDKTV